jgi:hypothetical protein
VVLCGSGVQAQEKKSAGKVCQKAPPAPWFDTSNCPSKAKPQVLSTGEFGENHTVICKNIFLVCGHTLTKHKTLKDNSGAGGHCLSSNDFSVPPVCCDTFDQAVKSKQPCDPLVDANCNGTANADDPDPLGSDSPECCDSLAAWNDYKRDLKIVEGIWDDAEKDSERSLEEFNEAGKEIEKELLIGLSAKVAEETVPKFAEHVLEETKTATALIKDLPTAGAGEFFIAGAGVMVPLTEAAAATYNLQVALNNFDNASRSQANMYLRADEKWKQLLADLKRAQECDAKAGADAEAEQELEKRARRYMEQGGIITPDGRVIDVYFVANKEYRDANAALEAAKKLVTARRQSGALTRQPFLRFAAFAPNANLADPSAQNYLITAGAAQESIRKINLAEEHLRRGTTLIVKELKEYGSLRQNLRSIRSRMGTGAATSSLSSDSIPTSSGGGTSSSTSGTPPQTNSRATISGTITSRDGTRLSDARVLLSGSMNAETRTDASGNYSFDNLVANGSSSYRVRPARSDSDFNPPLRVFDPLSQSQSANFIANAKTDGEQAGLRVEVIELKRSSGDTLTLRFNLINDSGESFKPGGWYFGDYKGHQNQDIGNLGAITLIDAAGKKQYSVIRDTDDNCECSGELPSVNAKSRVVLWAKFAAPPGDVKKIGVVIPHFIPIDDVPIRP